MLIFTGLLCCRIDSFSASVYIFTIYDRGYSVLVYSGLPIDVFPEAQSQVFAPWYTFRTRLGESSQVGFIEHDRIVALRRSQKYDYLTFASHPAQAMNTQIRPLALRINLAVFFIVLTIIDGMDFHQTQYPGSGQEPRLCCAGNGPRTNMRTIAKGAKTEEQAVYLHSQNSRTFLKY